MKKIISALVILAFGVGLAGFWGFGKNDYVAPAVIVEQERGHGSGVFIRPTIVLTAGHVADSLVIGKARVRGPDGSLYQIIDIKMQGEKDVAYLVVDKPYIGWIPNVSCDVQEHGAELINVGNPLNMEFLMAKLMVTGGKTGGGADDLGIRFVQGPVLPGQSGSPVFDSDGNVVGVIVVTLTYFESLQGISGRGLGVYSLTGWGGYVGLEYVCPFVQEALEKGKE